MTQTTEKTKVQLRPLAGRVLVRRIETQEKLKGGIILPDTAKKKEERAEVIAVGSGKWSQLHHDFANRCYVCHLSNSKSY